MAKPGHRRRNRPKSSGSILGGLGTALKHARENAKAVDKARAVFDSGGTLEDVFRAFSGSTSNTGDDVAWVSIALSLAHLRGISFNASVLLIEVANILEDVAALIDDLAMTPLKDVLEERADDE